MAMKTLDFQDLLTGDGLRSLFQPIVRLDDLSIVGFEALVRGRSTLHGSARTNSSEPLTL
jgi:EAL domain-containing protein (putative c-di-GMP-specific phosphodiesterase class I)